VRRNHRRILPNEDDSQSAARQAHSLDEVHYQAGIATHLDVLNADAQLHQAEIAAIQVTFVRLQDTVPLFAAPGGRQVDYKDGGRQRNRAAVKGDRIEPYLTCRLEKCSRTFAANCRSVILSVVSTAEIIRPS
jgi:hypothetical protein